MIEEIWKDIEGYEGLYQISSFGNVRNKKKNKLKFNIGKTGYLRVHLSKNNKSRFLYVHRLVITHFLGGFTNERDQTNHLDGDKKNNNQCNLEIVNRSENMKHSYEFLNHKRIRGEKQWKSKINKNDVDTIFSLRGAGMSMPKIGKEVGISAQHVFRILNKQAGLYL